MVISCISNGKDTIIYLTVGFKKRSCVKSANTFLSWLEVLEGILMIKLIFQTTQ